jgi:hypothetical protein
VKRADAQKAIDEAFIDGLKRTYANTLATCVTNAGWQAAEDEFARGVALHEKAHGYASSVIEERFEE